jgi:hypothetical protein
VGGGDGGCRGLDNDAIDFGIDRDNGRIFDELDPGGDSCGGERGAEVSGVEAGFFDEQEVLVLKRKSWGDGLEFGASELAGIAEFGGVIAVEGMNRCFGAERNFSSGEPFYQARKSG